ncbi:unnamed protein product [Urochloa humidicola]
MDSRNANAAAAAAPLPQSYLPHALLSLPDLDRPPAILEMWELEAVAAALPAKKRRLRETFDRLAASAPAPLPFRWDDLDAYISSLQYSATLRHRHQRGLDAPSRLAPAPAAVSAAPPATGQDGAHPMRALEKSSRPVHADVPVPIPPVVSEPPIAAAGDVDDRLRAHEESEPAHAHAHAPAPPSPAAVTAPATTGVDVGKGKKRKEADAVVHAAIRVPQEALHVQMPLPEMQEFAAAAAPLKDTSSDGAKSRPVAPGPSDGDGIVVAAANASTDATAQVDPVPVRKIAVVVPAAAAPARHGLDATSRARPAGRALPQRIYRPPRPVLAPSPAVSAATVVAGSQEAEAPNQKTPMQHGDLVAVATNTPHDGGESEVSPCRPGRGTMAQVHVDPIGKITGVRHESPTATQHATDATASPPRVASFSLAVVVPKQEPQGIEEEVPDVGMEVVEAEEPTKQERPNDEIQDVEMEIVEPEEMPALIEEDAAVANEKAASPLQVKAQEVKVSPLALACSNGSIAQAGVQQVDATSDTVRKSSPAAMHDVPNVLQATSALKSAAPAARDYSPAATRRGVNASTGLALPAAGREEDTVPPQANAPPKAASKKHVLQKQHMPKQAYYQQPVSSSAQKQNHSFSRNHGGHPAGSQPVPEAHAAAGQWNRNKKPGEGRGSPGQGGFAHARGMQEDGSRNNKGNAKRNKPPMFCNKCGCRGHLAETCRTAKHLVDLYLRAQENQICYRCGCTGHWSRKCRTPKHLVDLYQKDRAAKRAAQGTGSP